MNMEEYLRGNWERVISRHKPSGNIVEFIVNARDAFLKENVTELWILEEPKCAPQSFPASLYRSFLNEPKVNYREGYAVIGRSPDSLLLNECLSVPQGLGPLISTAVSQDIEHQNSAISYASYALSNVNLHRLKKLRYE